MLSFISHEGNAKKPQLDATTYPHLMAKVKKTDNTKCWQEYGANRALILADYVPAL